MSQRRIALTLGVNRKTVVRKIRFLATQATVEFRHHLEQTYAETKLTEVQFDDLETSEHTKLKPLSVAIAVDPSTRRILSFQVSKMPAKGLIRDASIAKYGSRKDERARGWANLMRDLEALVRPNVVFKSDENPHYPKHIKERFADATHQPVKSRRARAAGQGELKKGAHDPLFALNHTCAMLRANMSRLIRRTWCTTKKIQGLRDHLALYVSFHNRLLTSASAG